MIIRLRNSSILIEKNVEPCTEQKKHNFFFIKEQEGHLTQYINSRNRDNG